MREEVNDVYVVGGLTTNRNRELMSKHADVSEPTVNNHVNRYYLQTSPDKGSVRLDSGSDGTGFWDCIVVHILVCASIVRDLIVWNQQSIGSEFMIL